MVRREEARLRALLRRILIVSAASSSGAGAMLACSDATSSGGGDASTGAPDATAADSSSADSASDSAARDSAADSAGDSAVVRSCDPGPMQAFDAGADVAAGCAYAQDFPCGLPATVTMLYPPACYLALRDCAQICTGVAAGYKDCRVAENFGCDSNGAFVAPDGGPIKIMCATCAGVGRRPRGLVDARFSRASALGAFFARVAHLEAASVDAFLALEAELRERGAPQRLIATARRCARDETRHARVTARLARRFGGDVPAVRVTPRSRRSATAMAIENAVEGCVRETFGAMVATWQAVHAEDASIAAAMRRIAIDETRHAAMAWAVARWLDAKLDARSRARVRGAVRAAVDDLRRETAHTPDVSLVTTAGMPTASSAAKLLDAIESELWSAA